MKILLVIDEIWNDQMHGNNVLSNWFTGMDVELATICCNPGIPQNHCCFRYFQVTDKMMVKSLFGGKAGQIINISEAQMYDSNFCSNAEPVHQKFYSFMKSITNNFVYIVRDFIWMFGRYDKRKLKTFIEDFKPDIVYCPRMFTVKMCRLENIVREYTSAPFVAFVADDEISFNQINYSPLYWIRRSFHYLLFLKHKSIYKKYYTFSQDQCNYYVTKFNIPSSTLYKCGQFDENYVKKEVANPIRMVYAGSLYCNRWKTIAEIGKAMKTINKEGKKVYLDIYTKTELTEEQKQLLSPESYIFIKGAVPPEQLNDIYHNSDVALHVESFDKKYRLITKWSFSTKIVDLMSTGCAIFAVAWSNHSGYKYLKNNDIAICVDEYSNILPTIQRMVDEPRIITDIAERAYCFGRLNHSRAAIQKQILAEFQGIIDNNI